MSATRDEERRELHELFQEVLDAYEREASTNIKEGTKEHEDLTTTISGYRARFGDLLDRLTSPTAKKGTP